VKVAVYVVPKIDNAIPSKTRVVNLTIDTDTWRVIAIVYLVKIMALYTSSSRYATWASEGIVNLSRAASTADQRRIILIESLNRGVVTST